MNAAVRDVAPISFHDGKVVLYPGDCMALLALLPDNSIDAVCTDPPYHLTSIVKRFGAENAAPAKVGKTGAFARASRGFMGKVWDGGDIAFTPELWAKVLRVLKPGAFLAAFAGDRNYHRMACAIEDAGFEVRRMIAWVYGSGFPKSLNIALEAEKRLCDYNETERAWFYKIDGEPMSRVPPFRDDDANEWSGYGTDVKPALEPICLARKPLSEPTVLANVLRWGTGALNIDACRVEAENRPSFDYFETGSKRGFDGGIKGGARTGETTSLGRFPANLIHDGSPEVIAGFPLTSSGEPGILRKEINDGACYGAESRKAGTPQVGYGDMGSAARFFYTSKADAGDRVGSKHPTVKPVDLMQWLVRLICPKGGTVLDPFAGTGTTGAAAFIEGCRAILIEREVEYQADIARRMELLLSGPDERARKLTTPEPVSGLPLFAESAP